MFDQSASIRTLKACSPTPFVFSALSAPPRESSFEPAELDDAVHEIGREVGPAALRLPTTLRGQHKSSFIAYARDAAATPSRVPRSPQALGSS